MTRKWNATRPTVAMPASSTLLVTALMTLMVLGADNSPDEARGWAPLNDAAKPTHG